MAAQARWLPHKRKVVRLIPGQIRGCTDFYVLCESGAQRVLPCKGWGASQLDQPSLTSLSVHGCGRKQLGTAHWATSVTLLQVVDNWPHKIVVVDSAFGGLPAK